MGAGTRAGLRIVLYIRSIKERPYKAVPHSESGIFTIGFILVRLP